MSQNNNSKKLTMMALILMVFTSVFGFTNMPRGFFLMGYAAIPWYILSAILFFIPYAFMMAEFGAAFKNEKGGMYSWMEKSIGAKYAFVGTFMWYASYIVWMVSVGTGIWVPLSNAFFGRDMTPEWSLFGLNSTQTLGILASLLIIVVSYVSTKGIDKIKKVTSIGGTAVALLNLVLLIGGAVILIGNKGELAQPITNIAKSFTQSPNISYSTPLTILSFLTFAIFAFGGLEVIGGLVDQTENAERNFPKGVAISAIIIAIGYAVGIFACGIATNWTDILSSDKVTLGNVAYVLMNNFGFKFGQAIGLGEAASIATGMWTARFVGLSMFLALTGAFFTLTYSPLKTLIEGSPEKVWPGKLGKITNGMPINAMKVQAIIVIIMIILVSFGGDEAKKFFLKLTLMTNVAMTLPYLFLAGAFPAFKRKQLDGKLEKPFVVYKSNASAVFYTVVVCAVVGFANLFTIVEPVLSPSGDATNTIWMLAGPLLFAIVGFVLFTNYENKYLKK